MATTAFFTSLVLPALFALALYLSLTYVLLPLYRRHHARYSQYLPLNHLSPRNPNSLTTRSGNFLRDQILARLFRSSRTSPHRATGANNATSDREDDDADSTSLFGSEEGEGMVGFNVAQARREEQGRLPLSFDPRRGRNGARIPRTQGMDGLSDDRLSRELEEGFKDDSDEEQDRQPPHTNTSAGAGTGAGSDLNARTETYPIRISERINQGREAG